VASTFNPTRHPNERSLVEVLAEFRDELKDFVTTRIQMLTSEMREKVSRFKAAIPALIIAAFVGFTAWGLITWALIYLIAMGFGDQPWRMAAACGIVGVIYALIAGVAASYGVRTIRSGGLVPERTIRVLKQDQIWLKTEAGTQR
jgi:hypothetical protein